MMLWQDHITDAAKVAPTVAYVGTTVAGVQWSTLAQILACVYSALMIIDFVWRKWIRPFLERKSVISPKP